MTASLASATEENLEFGDADFRKLAALAHREFGLDLAESKKPLVYSRLSRRLKALGLARFQDYLALFDQPGNETERQSLISALTTNVTSFFREKHHFEQFRTDCLAPERARVEAGGRFRVWSAGCSTGPEPYSIAMTILQDWPGAGARDVRILATDIDPEVVQKARQGHYAPQDGEALRGSPHQRHIDMDPDGSARMKEDLRKLISFAELNLIAPWPFKGPFDAIFCRNVAIYFDQETQQRLWQRFSDMLCDGGLLFIGHSERLTGPATTSLHPAGITSYRKSGSPQTTHNNGKAAWD